MVRLNDFRLNLLSDEVRPPQFAFVLLRSVRLNGEVSWCQVDVFLARSRIARPFGSGIGYGRFTEKQKFNSITRIGNKIHGSF